MGWDVAEIGLNHDLPFDNPIETAKIISGRMRANVVLCLNRSDFIELERFEYQGSETEYYLEVNGKDLIEKIINEYSPIKYYDNENYYVLEDSDLFISIYKEWINLDVYVMERWGWWEYSFHHKDERCINVNKYRKEIYKQAQLFGCQKVAIMSDQGPTDYICSYSDSDKIEDLLDYINSYKYLDEYYQGESEKWSPDDYTHINIPDFMESGTLIPESKAISVMFDDFRDLKLTALITSRRSPPVMFDDFRDLKG